MRETGEAVELLKWWNCWNSWNWWSFYIVWKWQSSISWATLLFSRLSDTNPIFFRACEWLGDLDGVPMFATIDAHCVLYTSLIKKRRSCCHSYWFFVLHLQWVFSNDSDSKSNLVTTLLVMICIWVTHDLENNEFSPSVVNASSLHTTPLHFCFCSSSLYTLDIHNSLMSLWLWWSSNKRRRSSHS